jgi:hypothetical protein
MIRQPNADTHVIWVARHKVTRPQTILKFRPHNSLDPSLDHYTVLHFGRRRRSLLKKLSCTCEYSFCSVPLVLRIMRVWTFGNLSRSQQELPARLLLCQCFRGMMAMFPLLLKRFSNEMAPDHLFFTRESLQSSAGIAQFLKAMLTRRVQLTLRAPIKICQLPVTNADSNISTWQPKKICNAM